MSKSKTAAPCEGRLAALGGLWYHTQNFVEPALSHAHTSLNPRIVVLPWPRVVLPAPGGGAWLADQASLYAETVISFAAETIVSSPIKTSNDETPRGLFYDFMKWWFLVTASAWVLLALPLYLLGEVDILWGTIIGCALAALCFVVGFYSMCRNLHRSPNKLMIAFFGGMLARMLFIGLAFFLILWLTELHVVSLLASLFGFYILYLALELYFVNGRFKHIKEGQQWA